MTPTSIHSTCTCRFFHQGQCSCPDVTLFVTDAFFPDLSRDSAWTKAEQSETFTSGGVSFQYVTYRRK